MPASEHGTGRGLVRAGAAAIALVAGSACSAVDPPAGAERTETPAASSPTGSEDVGTRAWTASLDSRPTVAVIGPDGVYVTTAGSSRFAPQVYRLALNDGRQLARRTAVGQPNDAALAADGRLWVAAVRHPDQQVGTGINVQDPLSLLVVDQIELPDDPLSVAAVGATMWVGARSSIFVLDPATYSVVLTLAVGGPAYQLLPTPDGRHVIVVEGDALEALDVDGERVSRVMVESSGNVAAKIDTDAIWVRVPVDVDSELRRYELPGLAAVEPGPRLDSASGGLLVDAGTVWAVDDRADELVCVAADGATTTAPAIGVVSVLGALTDDRLLLATESGVQVRMANCPSGEAEPQVPLAGGSSSSVIARASAPVSPA